MQVSCPGCEHLNNSDELFCTNCERALYSDEFTIEKLVAKQAKLEIQHRKEMQSLKRQLDLTLEIVQRKETVSTTEAEEQSPEIVQFEEKVEENLIHTTKPVVKKPESPKQNQINKPPGKSTHPNYWDDLFSVLSPFIGGLKPVFNLFRQYKREGKLPIFFMTIAGIVAILVGTGYLMQYSFQYLGIYQDLAKIILGFTGAGISMTIGMILYRKGDHLHEFASALISLAIILNYLMIYFLSAISGFPFLSSGFFGFMLIVANTVAGSLLALKYETRIVSVLSLIGGALAPLFLNSEGEPFVYYSFLWLLIVGSNYVAHMIKWETLKYLSFIVGIGLLELGLLDQPNNSWVFVIFIHAFAYLFFYLSFISGKRFKNELPKTDVFIVAANFSILVFNLFDAFESSLIQLGIAYTLNALLFSSVLLINWNKLAKTMKLVNFIIIGSFLAFAVPAFFDQALFGLFWAIEALLLISLGFVYNLNSVRKEGYILLSIAIGKLLYSSSLILLYWGSSLWHEGFLNYLILGSILILVWLMNEKVLSRLTGFEKKLYLTVKEIIPVWLASVSLLISYEIFGMWGLNVSVLLFGGMLLWQKKFLTWCTEHFAYATLLALFVAIGNSMLEVGSFHFFDQIVYAKVAMLLFMMVLYFSKDFYEKLQLQQFDTSQLTGGLRIFFYFLLPLIVISQANRHVPEILPVAFWVAFLLSYVLHRRLKYFILLIQSYFLLGAAVWISVGELDVLALASGIVLMISIFITEKGYLLVKAQESAHIVFNFVAPTLTYFLISVLYFETLRDNPIEALAIFAFLLFTSIYLKDQFTIMKGQLSIASKLANVVNMFAIMGHAFDQSVLGLAIITANLILFAIMLNNQRQWYDLKNNRSRWNAALLFYHISVTFFGLVFLNFLELPLDGPHMSVLLVLHATIAMIISLKNRIRIVERYSIFLFVLSLIKIAAHDIRDFNAVQKIIVLVVIGLLLLGASYVYLRLKKKYELVRQTADTNSDKDSHF